jgi:C_GCAxxG_C_C family probable redox protein
MTKQEIEQNTFKHFLSGYHCAESIARAIIESRQQPFDPQWIKAASAFQGGIGKCHEDACGALTGGIVALGVLGGRTEPGQDISATVRMANLYRRKFLERFGSTNCAVLVKTLVDPNPEFTCKHLTSEAAGLLAEILEEESKAGG